MVGKILWQQIKELVALDARLALVNSDSEKIKVSIVANERLLVQAEADLEAKRRLHAQAQKSVDREELQAAVLQAENVNRRAALDVIKNQKEYKALEKELDMLNKQSQHHDDLLQRVWHTMEQAKKSLDDAIANCEQRKSSLAQDTQTKQQQLELFQKNLEELRGERKVFEGKIPTEWLARYERMKHSVTDPIVPALFGSCSACFYSIPYQDLVRLKKSGLLLCRNCYRFLYYDEEEQVEAKNANF